MRIDLDTGSSPFDSDYWMITRELTKTLAIQLLHHHSKKSLSRMMAAVQEERDEIQEILIRQIRKMMTKLSLVYRVIDNEAARLRQAWEDIIHECHPGEPCRANIVAQLNLLLQELDIEHEVVAESETVKQLVWCHNKLAENCFLPEENEAWFQQRILPLWKTTASRYNSVPKSRNQMKKLLDQLQQSFYVGLNETLIDKINAIPHSVKSQWKSLAYNEKNWTKVDLLKKYIHLLEGLDIKLPNKRKTLENLLCLRSLVLYVDDLENKLNNYIEKYKTYTAGKQIYLH
jgi:hypothetical protein